MRHLVVHIGAECTAAEEIHRGIYTNLDLLASRGILVPETGRHEQSPKAVRHTLLAWSLDPSGRPRAEHGIWSALAAELDRSDLSTAVLTSERVLPIAADPRTAPMLLDRFRGLADAVTIALVIRHQIPLLNTLYGHRVRSFDFTGNFAEYVEHAADPAVYDLERTFEPWHAALCVRVVAVPWSESEPVSALGSLLAEAGLPIQPGQLASPPASVGERLGPLAILALRTLGERLRTEFADFHPNEAAARKLRRRAYTTVLARGWCLEDFWGWSPERARAADARYAESNQAFAQRIWGTDWSLGTDLDKASNELDPSHLDPATTGKVSHFVDSMVRRFTRMRLAADDDVPDAADRHGETELESRPWSNRS